VAYHCVRTERPPHVLTHIGQADNNLKRTGFVGGPIPKEDVGHARPSKYSSEVRERFVRLAQEHTVEQVSHWAAVAAIAPKAGCTVETLRRWVRQAERDAGQRGGLTTDERAELKRLQGESWS